MGRKKRDRDSSSKNLPTPSPAADKAVEEEKTEAMVLESTHINSGIGRAQKACHRGNYRRALMITKELRSHNPSSAMIQFFHATVIFKEANSVRDPTAKKRYLRNALEPAQRAMSLEPDISVYVHFYAWLLFDLASNAEAYKEVVEVCERTMRRLQDRGLSGGILQNDFGMLAIWSKYIVQQLSQKNANFDAEEFKQKKRDDAKGKMRQIKAEAVATRVTQETLQYMDFKEEEQISLGSLKLQQRKILTNDKKNTALGVKIARVQQYWNSLSADTKRGFLKVRISDLKEHFSSFKNDLAEAVLSEAIRLLQENDSWKLMECSACDEKFTDLLLYVEHFYYAHKRDHSEWWCPVPRQEIDSDSVDIIEKGGWKPADARAVLQISEDQLKSKSSSHVECRLMDMVVYMQNCIKDPSESYSVEEVNKQLDEVLLEAEIGNQNYEKAGKHELEGSEWPLSDDPRRAKILQKIQAMLQMLLKAQYLSRAHVLQLIRYTTGELLIFSSELQLRNLGLDNTLRGICLLEFPQLENVLSFLHSIVYICRITKFPKKDEALAGAQESEIKETIRFSIDSSHLLLDERLLTGELDVSTSNNSISNEGSASTFALDDHEDDKLPGSGRFVPWLFVGRSVEEKLALWERLIEDREYKKIEAHNFLDKQFSILMSLCDRKTMLPFHDKRFKLNMDAVDVEPYRIAQNFHEHLLEEGKEELEVVDFLSKLLEQAVNRTKAIREYEVRSTLTHWRTDATITRTLHAIQQEVFKVGEASARAYRSIIVISLKSFIGTLLEYLVKKDATEKASAAEEALLADLALDAKKSVDRGDGKKKETQIKSKKKKYRKSGDLKASSSGKQFPLCGEDVEQQELSCQVELETKERRRKTTLESQLRIDGESEKQHPSEQNKLGERIEQHSSDETAIGTISPGGLQKPDSSSEAGQKIIFIGKIPIVLPPLYEKLEKGKSVVFSKGSDYDLRVSAPLPSSSSDSSNETDDGDSDHEDSENLDQDDHYNKNSMLCSMLRIGTFVSCILLELHVHGFVMSCPSL